MYKYKPMGEYGPRKGLFFILSKERVEIKRGYRYAYFCGKLKNGIEGREKYLFLFSYKKQPF